MLGSLVAPTILHTKPSRLLIIKFCKAANYCHDEVVTTRKLSTNTSMLHTQDRLKILSISLIMKTTTTIIIVTCNLPKMMMNFQFCGKLNYWAACGTQLWNELSLSKKDKMVDRSPRRHSMSHSPYNGASFWEEGMGHLR